MRFTIRPKLLKSLVFKPIGALVFLMGASLVLLGSVSFARSDAAFATRRAPTSAPGISFAVSSGPCPGGGIFMVVSNPGNAPSVIRWVVKRDGARFLRPVRVRGSVRLAPKAARRVRLLRFDGGAAPGRYAAGRVAVSAGGRTLGTTPLEMVVAGDCDDPNTPDPNTPDPNTPDPNDPNTPDPNDPNVPGPERPQ